MSDIYKKESFLGFTLNGTHSSEFLIVRVNTGNRAEMPLSPNFKRNTLEIPGRDGIYHLNTQIQQLTFTINFAYDRITDEQIRSMREWLSPKKTSTLIFDEFPYKQYTGGISSPPKLSYICFDESSKGGGKRIYKGEGSISFQCDYPYARAPYKDITEYDQTEVEEWGDNSGISKITTTSMYNNGGYGLYNPGDFQSPLTVSGTITSDDYISLNIGDKYLILKNDGLSGKTIKIDTYTKTITIDNEAMSVQYIVAGDFLYVPIDTDYIKEITTTTLSKLTNKLNISGIDSPVIEYPYLYQ